MGLYRAVRRRNQPLPLPMLCSSGQPGGARARAPAACSSRPNGPGKNGPVRPAEPGPDEPTRAQASILGHLGAAVAWKRDGQSTGARGRAGRAAEATRYPWFGGGGRRLMISSPSSISKPDCSRCFTTRSAIMWRASSGACSVMIRRSRSRLRVTAKPIEKASWSRNERGSHRRRLFWFVLRRHVIAWRRGSCQGDAALLAVILGASAFGLQTGRRR
jgi:hypothetical protein